MINWFMKRLRPDGENIVNLGAGYIAIKLSNGCWIMEKRFSIFRFAIDLQSPAFKWRPGNKWYKDCFAHSFQELERKAKDIIALRHGK